MTVYSYFLFSESGRDPEFQATRHDGDDRALDHAKLIFRREPTVKVIEVWEGPLKLAQLDRKVIQTEARTWRELLRR